MSTTVERRVEFWRLRAYKDDLRQDIVPLLNQIRGMPPTPGARYQDWMDGSYLSMEVSNHALPFQGMLGTTRMKGLPMVDQFGTRRGLALAQDEGLYEPTHFILFDDELLGVEYNYYGPRPRSIQNYMHKALRPAVDRVEMVPLIHPEIHDQLQRLKSVSLVNLSVHRDATERLAAVDSNLFDSLRALEKGSEAPYLGVSLELAPYGRKGFDPGSAKKLRNLFQGNVDRHDFKRLVVNGMDEQGESMKLDLLSQFVVARKRVVKQDEIHRTVDSNRMFQAITDARVEMQDQVAGALDRLG